MYTHTEIYTYVHIPTGVLTKTCHNFSNDLLMQRTVYLYGYNIIEWEKIKTDIVPIESPLVTTLMTNNHIEIE